MIWVFAFQESEFRIRVRDYFVGCVEDEELEVLDVNLGDRKIGDGVVFDGSLRVSLWDSCFVVRFLGSILVGDSMMLRLRSRVCGENVGWI